ncbi:hypothetical protein TD95_002511 [Thielaviopsis punctulata]|uniref:Vacuolar protein 14 C-terminal Fig4-binding domain-containing protein n=1 Tax=Thielaviopsis punctulata TaxID=72032 RepID=A0A0F4ZHD1_9PEZI|nr:hypothetical protein TD95_002511 [Thielaviopsis punctulata]
MDASIQRSLCDKFYDKRKTAALELERVVRHLVIQREYDAIDTIIDQLCNDFTYQSSMPLARNGGLIGLAAAAIALGHDLPQYLRKIVPPVVACFTDPEARVRYYACESMYNIAKVAKGEILYFFNHLFDCLCKLCTDHELSVKNGAELLDRLVKDIVSESAVEYVSLVPVEQSPSGDKEEEPERYEPAFSLPKFIPLLKEKIWVQNPNARQFLVGWIVLLDSIPDLELVSYLPEFLAGLLKFLTDENSDVNVATRNCLDRFLSEIRRISNLQNGIAENKKSNEGGKRKRVDSIDSDSGEAEFEKGNDICSDEYGMDDEVASEADWQPGLDVKIDYERILETLTATLDSSSEESTLLEALRWIEEFLKICPDEVLPFTPRILTHMLHAIASGVESTRNAAARVNTLLMNYIGTLDDVPKNNSRPSPGASLEQVPEVPSGRNSVSATRELEGNRAPTPTTRSRNTAPSASSPIPFHQEPATPALDLDYGAAVTSLTLLFLNDHEETRVAALTWLLMLHQRSPRKVLAYNDAIFPALLKTLSDSSEAVVTKDLQLLSQIARNSDDNYFSSFMSDLLRLFFTDRNLLETRGNLIIRQLCVNLSPEKIYRRLADCIEQEDDIEFASIMVQNLNNNLVTAPQLAELRKRLRNLDVKEGQTLFVALFRSWCYNSVATFSLCLLAQAYEQAYHLLQIFAEFEMTVNLLIQIDKLVQLIESPVFTYLRLQLLEPEKYPYLYKCLYGLLMLLPQSSAFAALKNRLNSVSAMGYLHIPQRTTPYMSYSPTASGQNSSSSSFDRSNRLKGREDNSIRWGDLLEKFRSVQDRSRRAQRRGGSGADSDDGRFGMSFSNLKIDGESSKGRDRAQASQQMGSARDAGPVPSAPAPKPKSGLGRQFGRLGGAVGRAKRNQ